MRPCGVTGVARRGATCCLCPMVVLHPGRSTIQAAALRVTPACMSLRPEGHPGIASTEAEDEVNLEVDPYAASTAV